jgi:quercetin dioxygenase-like cupin family protein
MSVQEASSAETPFGRYITSDGWFVLNLADALAVRNAEKGGATYPIEPREHPFGDIGVHVTVVWPGGPNALYHSEGAQEGFLVLSGACTLIVEDEERPLRQWDYFHCPGGTGHVLVGAGDGPCAILMIGARPGEPFRYPVSEVAARYVSPRLAIAVVVAPTLVAAALGTISTSIRQAPPLDELIRPSAP